MWRRRCTYDVTVKADPTKHPDENAKDPAAGGARFSPASFILLYAIVSILLIPIFPHFVSPNEFSRWATTISLVEGGGGAIDWSVPIIGRTEDTSTVNGVLYSNKPPGTSIAGIPGYLAGLLVGTDATSIRASLTMMRATASTLPVILIGILLLRCGNRLDATPGQQKFAIVALLFGTPLFPYGTLYFSHALAAFGLFLAVTIGFVAPYRSVRISGLAIGLGLGLAGWSEYTAAIFVMMVLAALILQRRWQELVFAAIAGTPFLAALLFYQWSAFASPFAISNSFESYGEFSSLSQRGVFGIGAPSLLTMLRLLFDPTNGLVLISPVVAISLAGSLRMSKRISRVPFWLITLVPLAALLLFSGYPNWHGGWSVGPRYLVPILPLLAIPLLFATPSRISSALLGWSVAATILISMTFPFVPNGMTVPWGSPRSRIDPRGLRRPKPSASDLASAGGSPAMAGHSLDHGCRPSRAAGCRSLWNRSVSDHRNRRASALNARADPSPKLHRVRLLRESLCIRT